MSSARSVAARSVAAWALASGLALTLTSCAGATTEDGLPTKPVDGTISIATPSATDMPTTAPGTSSSTHSSTTATPEAIDTAAEAKAQAAAIAAGEFVLVPERKIVAFPAWSGTDVNGNSFTTASLVGKKTLVNFWASWCGPCREEWPILQEAATAHPDVRFVGINIQDSLERAKGWLAEHPTSYTHAFDQRALTKASLTTVPNMGLPITVILDGKGRIYAWFSGPVNQRALAKILS